MATSTLRSCVVVSVQRVVVLVLKEANVREFFSLAFVFGKIGF